MTGGQHFEVAMYYINNTSLLNYYYINVMNDDIMTNIVFIKYCIDYYLTRSINIVLQDPINDKKFREETFNDMVDLIDALSHRLLDKMSPSETVIDTSHYDLHKKAFFTLYDPNESSEFKVMGELEEILIDYATFIDSANLNQYLMKTNSCYMLNEFNLQLVDTTILTANKDTTQQLYYLILILFLYWLLDRWNILPEGYKIDAREFLF